MRKADQQQRAMAHWNDQKKKEQLRREYVELRTLEMRQKLEEQKKEIARQKFSEWYNKKELERLSEWRVKVILLCLIGGAANRQAGQQRVGAKVQKRGHWEEEKAELQNQMGRVEPAKEEPGPPNQ